MPFRDMGLVLACYALGCLCTGYYVVRLSGRGDIRRLGSGSAGARNVGRVLGRWGFAITLLADAAKGAAAIGLVKAYGHEPWTAPAGLVAVAAGHIWPVQLGFHGGRGIAATLGGLLVYDARLVVLAMVLFAVLYAVWRNYMGCGLLAVGALPIMAGCLGYERGGALGLVVLVGLLLMAHRSHIREQWDGYRCRNTSACTNEGPES